MAKLLLGKEVNASINEEIKAKVEKLKAQDITPTLGIIRIGLPGAARFPDRV